MKVPFIFGAAFAAIAIAGATPSAALGIGETVTPHFSSNRSPISRASQSWPWL